MKSLLRLVITLSLTVFLTACSCEHQWSNATCEKSVTCSVCGETAGDALGHQWQDAACTTPKTCSVCRKTEGEALGHQWKEAMCTTPKTCDACDATEGASLGHQWKEATYSAPKTCSVCSVTEGTALSKPSGSGNSSSSETKRCMMQTCDTIVTRSDTNYCTFHDCYIMDCPYPAKTGINCIGSTCVYHSCAWPNCTTPKQQSNLPYCGTHLDNFTDEEIQDMMRG